MVAVRIAVFVTGPSIVFETVTVAMMGLVVLPTAREALSVQLNPDAGGWQMIVAANVFGGFAMFAESIEAWWKQNGYPFHI